MKHVLIAATCALGFSSIALAADMPKREPATPASSSGLEDCAFITNNCETCVVDAEGKAACSSAGIACVPTEKTCLIKKNPQ